jgi:hypothetical protein
MITQEILKERFEYRDGELYWKIKTSNIKIGDMVGHKQSTGYIRASVKGKFYLSHRLIFLMFHGYLPKFIDHIDNNPSNNKIENLREATKSQNGCNQKISVANTSGVKGIIWFKRNKKWGVQLNINGKNKYFGLYHNIEVAKFIAETMRYKYHGAFANHGGVE